MYDSNIVSVDMSPFPGDGAVYSAVSVSKPKRTPTSILKFSNTTAHNFIR